MKPQGGEVRHLHLPEAGGEGVGRFRDFRKKGGVGLYGPVADEKDAVVSGKELQPPSRRS